MIAYFQKLGSSRRARKSWSGRWWGSSKSPGRPAEATFRLDRDGPVDDPRSLLVVVDVPELRAALQSCEGLRDRQQAALGQYVIDEVHADGSIDVIVPGSGLEVVRFVRAPDRPDPTAYPDPAARLPSNPGVRS